MGGGGRAVWRPPSGRGAGQWEGAEGSGGARALGSGRPNRRGRGAGSGASYWAGRRPVESAGGGRRARAIGRGRSQSAGGGGAAIGPGPE